MSETVFSQAQSVEKVSIVILLTECGLSIREMNSSHTRFIVAKQEGKIIGCVGFENCGRAGLLHSLAVKRDFRGQGLGRQLYEKMSAQSLDEGVEEFYVLTRAAEGLFAKWGFETIDREQTPDEIRDTNDFKNDIFATYTCMKKKLERQPGQETVQTAAASAIGPETATVPEEPRTEEKNREPVVPPAAEAPEAVQDAPKNIVVPEEPSSLVIASTDEQGAKANSVGPAEEPPVAAPAAVDDTLVLMVPSPDVALAVPADAVLMKVPSDVTVPGVPAVPDTPDTQVPAPVQKEMPAASAQYFPADRLPLIVDMPGTRAWGVSLSSTMLKYYEMAPQTQMEAHTHGYEHITMVVEGQLFFGVGDKVIPIRGGEMIAMPANVPHSVFTNDQPAKAFEAVSPVPEEGGK